jgi:hypothetical protein
LLSSISGGVLFDGLRHLRIDHEKSKGEEMSKSRPAFWRSLSLALCFSSFAAVAMGAEEVPVQQGAEVIYEIHHDLSLPVRDMILLNGQKQTQPAGPRVTPLGTSGEPYSATSVERDAVLQEETTGPLVSTTNLLNFDGINDTQGGGAAPPDTNGSVGTTQFVQTVNTAYEVYNKTTGASVLGPLQIKTLFSGFGGACQNGPSFRNPIVLFDKLANRWVISILASPNSFSTGLECVAVSTADDATGSFNRYSFSFGSNLGDYPKLGTWTDAYYLTVNKFSSVGTLVGADSCALDRTKMLAGSSATAQCFQKASTIETILPADVDGTTAPSSGEPNFQLQIKHNAAGSTLNFFKFHVDFTTPSNSTYTGPTTIGVTSYNQACGGQAACIPESGTTQLLDSLGDRLMFRLAYRNFGGHESLVVNHSVNPGLTGIVSGVRWYEIRSPNTTPTVFQQGTFSSATTNFWMGSIAMDKNGDIALGYSASSKNIHPSIAYTGRVPTDALGTLEPAKNVISGGGSQTGGLSSWGGYSGMSIDPTDDCTFWYTSEYLKTNGSFNWSTRIVSFKFNSCT